MRFTGLYTCMYECVCVCVCVRGSRVVSNVRFWADRDTALYIHGSRLSASMTLGSSCLSVILYTSPHLYTVTLHPSAERSSPALIQLGFIKPDHWRIRVMRFLLCEEHWISVCIYVRIEKIIHVDTVGMCACVCVFGSWQLITAQHVIGQTGCPKEPWEQSWGAGNEQWPQQTTPKPQCVCVSWPRC